MTRRALATVLIGLAAVGTSAQEIRLPVGDARVTGRVIVAESGVPLAGAEVQLQGLNLPPDLAYRTHTDASGNFDFQNVYPREYRLTATKAGFYARVDRLAAIQGVRVVVGQAQSVANATVALFTGGVISGRVVDALGEPVDRIRVYAKRLRYNPDGTRGLIPNANESNDVTDDLGQFRVFALEPGDYLVVASGRSSDPVPPVIDVFQQIRPGDTVPTYYPGTPDIAQAQVVSLSGGQQVPVQIVLSDQRAVSVSGRVVRSDGSPGGGLELGLNQASGFTMAGRYGGKVPADGTFVLHGVPPGSYQLIAFAPPLPTESGAVVRVPGYGEATVTVVDQHVQDLVVTVSPGATITGSVVFEQPFTGPSVQIQAVPKQFNIGLQSVTSGSIGPDGAFTLSGVHEGATISARAGGWMVKSVIVDGREIGDAPIPLGGRAALSGVRVTLTNRIPGVSLVTRDDKSRPLANQRIIVMRLDQGDAGATARVTPFQTGPDGTFTFRGLRPGPYVAGLMTEAEIGIEFSAEYQDRLRQYGQRFTIEEGGEAVRLELQPTKGL